VSLKRVIFRSMLVPVLVWMLVLAFDVPRGRTLIGGNWTFMVYLDGDNNLEDAAIADFQEMAVAGSTGDVNIFVQMDRIRGYDESFDNWTGCKRYLVTYNLTPTVANALQDLGEVNMGDPNVLIDFVIWGMQNYPASNYAVVLWDHGSGWKSRAQTSKGVCYDDTDFDYLTTAEVEQALATVESTTGVKIDVVGFDACLMSMIEVACQIGDHADVMVGSEEVEPWEGWPYGDILLNLTSNPAVTSDELATVIVTDYASSLPYEDVTQSATNLGLVTHSRVDDLAAATSNFAQELVSELDTYIGVIAQARNQTEQYADPTYVDLYHFAELVHDLVSDPNIQNAAQQVMNTLTDTVIAEGHRSEHPNSHGLSIYFPRSMAAYDMAYGGLKFAKNTSWDEFLWGYYALAPHYYVRSYVPNQWIDGGVPMEWHDDDYAWMYVLPFDFPFYGIFYRTVYVSSNGLVTFAGADSSYGNGLPELASRLAMAPAWDDWVTYEPYDIYVRQPDSDHVAIKWEVLAWGSSTVANLEAVLGVDGVIQFNCGYNDGTVSATVGISDGLGDMLAEDLANLNYTNSVVFAPALEASDVAVTEIVPSKSVVSQGFSSSINVTVANQGPDAETFNVTLYAQSQETINETGLVGYWKLDEGSGTTAYDSSGYNNHGIIYGASWTSGKVNSALSFDGVDDYVDCGTDPSLMPTTAITLEAWFKASGVNAYATIVSTFYYEGYFLRINPNAGIEFAPGICNSPPGTIQPGVWYHVVGTFDGTSKIYVNGKLVSSQGAGYLAYTGQSLRIGNNPTAELWFNGIIDEVRIYNRALSAEEIWAEYTRTGGRFAIQTQSVTLEAGASAPVTFTWNTSGFAKGNYTISAYATLVPGETDTTDNALNGGWLVVTIPGDFNGDFKVGPADFALLSVAYGSTPDEPNWNPNCDVNNDQRVGPADFAVLSKYYGQHDP